MCTELRLATRCTACNMRQSVKQTGGIKSPTAHTAKVVCSSLLLHYQRPIQLVPPPTTKYGSRLFSKNASPFWRRSKPNPQWTLGISLNTIVSILSTVFRASLMLSVAHGLSQSGWIWFTQRPRPLSDICWYDSASRGPLGSVQLLWRLRLL